MKWWLHERPSNTVQEFQQCERHFIITWRAKSASVNRAMRLCSSCENVKDIPIRQQFNLTTLEPINNPCYFLRRAPPSIKPRSLPNSYTMPLLIAWNITGNSSSPSPAPPPMLNQIDINHLAATPTWRHINSVRPQPRGHSLEFEPIPRANQPRDLTVMCERGRDAP